MARDRRGADPRGRVTIAPKPVLALGWPAWAAAFGQDQDAWRDLIGAVRTDVLQSDDQLRREVLRTTRRRRHRRGERLAHTDDSVAVLQDILDPTLGRRRNPEATAPNGHVDSQGPKGS